MELSFKVGKYGAVLVELTGFNPYFNGTFF